MKRFIILLFCININSALIFAVETINEPGWVRADGGLRMREAPDLNAELIITIPNGDEVMILEEKGVSITISGATGKWTRVKWKDKEGWVFGGFLSRTNPESVKIATKDILGEWSYYFPNSGKAIKYFFLNEKSIVGYLPTARESTWHLSGNTIYADFDTGGQLILKYKWEILEYKKDYLKVRETWSAMDTGTKIIELFRNAEAKTIGDTPIRTLTGHTDYTTAACFSPDSKYILSGSYDNTLKLWDVSSGKEIKTFTGHTARVNSVDISPDGKYAVSGAENKVIIYWDIKEGKEIKEIVLNVDPEKNPIYSVCFSPDGKSAVLGLKSGWVGTIDLKSGNRTKTFFGHKSEVKSACFSPDGKYVLTGSYDKTMKLWEVKSEKLKHSFLFGYSTDYDKLVTSVCFSRDGRYALAGSADDAIYLYNIESLKEINIFTGHKGNVNSVCFTPNGKYFISGSDDGTVKLWKIEGRNEIKTLYPDEAYVQAVDISPDGKFALSVHGKSIKVWDIAVLIK